MDAVEQHAMRLSAILLSAEDWSKQYLKAPEQHAAMLQTTAKFQIILTKFFRDMAKQSRAFVKWSEYKQRVKLDYRVDVTVNDDEVDKWDDTFIKATLQTVSDLVAIGAAASETIYNVPLGITSTEAAIQNLGIDQVAKLVGKKVIYNEDKTIREVIDNPNTEYNVTDTVRKDIAASVKRSLALGRTTDEATEDIQKVIANPNRAKLIAQTESVNAYGQGVLEFGRQSEAVGKQWYDAGADDVCVDNTNDGPIPIDALFSGGVLAPTQHPRCRCGMRLIYQAEWDTLQK